MARIYVGGPSGCGKTVACIAIAHNLGISCLTGSEIMMKAAGITSRHDLDELPEKVKSDLRLTAFTSHYKETPNLIMDGHFYLTNRDIEWFNGFVLIEINANRLIQFRKDDPTRERPVEILILETEIFEVHSRVKQLESEFGINVIRIRNDGSLDNLKRSIEGVYTSSVSPETRSELQHNRMERI